MRLHVALALVLIGCGGGGGPERPEGGAPPGDGPAPAEVDGALAIRPLVIATMPGDAEGDVEPGMAIEARFSTHMRPESFTPGSFTLTVGGLPVAGTVEYELSFHDFSTYVARFRPHAPLKTGTTYVATIAAAVSDLDGVTMAAPHTWRFTTGDRAWESGPVSFDDGLAEMTGTVATARTADGVMAVWRIPGGSLLAAHYIPDAGWEPPVLVGTDVASRPSIAASASGHVIVAWRSEDGSPPDTVRASHFSPGAGWSLEVRVDTEASRYLGDLDVAIDDAGNATVIWGWNDLWSRRLRADGTWEPPVRIAHHDDFDDPPRDSGPEVAHAVLGPRLVVDGAGVATAVWLHHNTAALLASQRAAGGTWSAPVAISGDGHAGHAELVADDAGAVTAMWLASANGGTLRSTRLTGGAWSEPVTVYDRFASGVRLAADASGAVTALWRTEHQQGFASRFVPGGGWGPPVMVTPVGHGAPAIAVDADGTVTSVWEMYATWHQDPQLVFAARRFVPGAGPGAGWQPIAVIGAHPTGQTLGPQLSVTADGTAVAMWPLPLGEGTDRRELWLGVYR